MSEWVASKPIPGYEGLYRITCDGRVWSEPKVRLGKGPGGVPTRKQYQGKWLKPGLQKDGYGTVNLWRDGKYTSPLVHRLVAAAFVPGNDETVDHLDFDTSNNHFSNLEWVSNTENLRRRHER